MALNAQQYCRGEAISSRLRHEGRSKLTSLLGSEMHLSERHTALHITPARRILSFQPFIVGV
jgi:hypothetical protein